MTDRKNPSMSLTLKTSRRVTFFGRPYLWCENDGGQLTLIPDFSEHQFRAYRAWFDQADLPSPLPPGDYTLPRHTHGS